MGRLLDAHSRLDRETFAFDPAGNIGNPSDDTVPMRGLQDSVPPPRNARRFKREDIQRNRCQLRNVDHDPLEEKEMS